MNISTDPWAWIAAFLVLAIYSFLYKENPVFRFAEHLYIGVGSGWAIAVAWNSLKATAWAPFVGGQYRFAIPMILGLLLYTRFSKDYAWISRLSLAIPIGLGIGIALRGLPASQITSQIRATMIPLWTGTLSTSINNTLLVLGVMGTIAFFFFTTKQTPLVRGMSWIGKWTMMITFGLTFATGVFGQMAIYMGALQVLLGRWLGMIK
jgi:hypothetical protein